MKSKIFWWTLTVIWCSLIFYQSGKCAPDSTKESLYVVILLNRWISQVLGSDVIVISETMVRKAAHCMEYLVLGAFLFMGFLDRVRTTRSLLFALVAGVLYAASDEVHQHFVPGRTARLVDLMVDTVGILFSTLLLYAESKRRTRQVKDRQADPIT